MIDPERRHELVLRAREATNIERDLRSVMGAVAEVLSPHVPIDGMGIVVWSGTFPTGGAPRLLDIHVPGGLPNEKVDEILRDADKPVDVAPDRPIVAYDEALRREMQAGIPYTCSDLLAKKAWYPHEHRLVAGGVRAYTSVPMKVRGRLIGTAVFSRRTALEFDQDQLSLLSDVSRALSVAVANALANEEIRVLRDQLETEKSSYGQNWARLHGSKRSLESRRPCDEYWNLSNKSHQAIPRSCSRGKPEPGRN